MCIDDTITTLTLNWPIKKSIRISLSPIYANAVNGFNDASSSYIAAYSHICSKTFAHLTNMGI